MFEEKLIKEIIKQAYIGKPENGVFFFVPTKSGKDVLYSMYNKDVKPGCMSMHQDLWEEKIIPFLMKEFNIDEGNKYFNNLRNLAQEDYHYPLSRGAVSIKYVGNEWSSPLIDTVFIDLPKDKQQHLDEIISRFYLHDVDDKIDVGFVMSEYGPFPLSEQLFKQSIETKQLETA